MIYSGILHPTASLFLSGNFVEINPQTCIIVDDEEIVKYIDHVGGWIYGKKVHKLTNPGEIFGLDQYGACIFLVPSSILRIEGNQESIKRSNTLFIERDVSYSQNDLIEKILSFGFTQSNYPGESGTYTREGSLIRIWKEDREYVIEHFDDTIESILELHGERRLHRPSLYIFPEKPYSPQSTLRDLSIELLTLLKEIPTLLIGCEFLKEREYIHTNFRNIIEYSSLTREGSERLELNIPSIDSLPAFLEYNTQEENGRNSYIAVTRYEKKLQEFCSMNNLIVPSSVEYHHIRESFIGKNIGRLLGSQWKKYITHENFTLLSDDIFGKIFIQNRIRKTSMKNLDLLLRIKEGDLVVHREHGIGRYKQILRKRIGLMEREYMEIEYKGEDRVFVPMTELARITKYVGDAGVELSNLEGKEWEKSMKKTDEEVEEIAEEILETEAKRSLATRIPFGKFEEEEEKFRQAFSYTHTEDQLGIIEDIARDMESSHPMDRLIAGDVGFGKTEVAMNAVYKAVLSGMQVAVISPLLILAEEHRETFEERLGAFGVRVKSLTRMTHAKEVKETITGIQNGTIDVVVGTHRLLSEDICFRRLGLLVIDEEHRFGVAQKELIKKMKAHVDILSLSATPIPRSLHLALSGLKKISLLTTPPPSKKPIDTIVTRWEEHTIKQAIQAELAREGQVIILHNRIRSLPMIEKEIEEILKVIEKEGGANHGKKEKSSRIIVTHGQMPPDDIEDRIYDFKHKKHDILISTTVIENGVNFLGANTIIVSDAEEFGLAQLHQIRGRVGRKDVSGICYLLYRKYELSSEERERLMILAEHSALGSGYEIAMRDMQMRGTGDILGFRQSGKTKEVGISLYFQLLEEKIETLKYGKKTRQLCKIDLELSYVIPDEEFDSEADKLSFFRDIESIETLEDLDRAESTFRKDDIPESMSNLFLMMRVSIILTSYNVVRLSKLGNNYHFDFLEGTLPEKLRAFLERFDQGREMIIVSITKIRMETKHHKDARDFLLSLIDK